jgi:polyisoprenyl-teichoic acid--peptidoglycan teichoic acid transferase
MARRHVGGRRYERVPVAGLWRALGLTAASTVVWGVAHVWAGRRGTGYALMALLASIVVGAGIIGLGFRQELKQIAVQHTWLDGITAGILLLALVWGSVVIRSFQVVRPAGLPMAMRLTSGTLVVVLAMMVCTPLVYAANATFVLRDTLSSIFPGDDSSGQQVDAANPWKNKPRVNVLLLGGDGGKDRTGIRTDSMTVASIDTKTGDSVLFSLPRQLQYFQMPPRLRRIWPNGFRPTGGMGFSGMLNEVYLTGEQHPNLVPGFKAGQRGPHLLEEVIGNLLGLKLDYYVLVNLDGFKDIVDAIGGVRVHVEKRLPIGGQPERGIPPTGYLEPGWHKLDGEKALWYGRSRHADDDFHRMDRQKCLLKDIADQADPQKVVTHFEKLARAAKKTISTNIPAALLPALVKLSGTVKQGADIHSLPFNPYKIPGFHIAPPSTAVMRRVTAKAIANSEQPKTPSPNPTSTAKRRKTTTNQGAEVSLKDVCG